MPKRDRWSSDEEGDDEKVSQQNGHVKPADKNTNEGEHPASSSQQQQSATKKKAAPPPGFCFHNPLLDGCRSVYDSYERLSHLDEGTYGVVWKARDNSTKEIVALKQIKFDSDMTKEG